MLKLYQSNRIEYLADLLVEITSMPLNDPFAAETIVVQHPGMGRWLSLQIAEQAGICANYRFPLPASFVWELFRRLLPGLPEQQHFTPSVMQWALYSLLESNRDEKRFRSVDRYLQTAGDPGRLELAHRLAVCFDQYLVYRPDWIRSWERGASAVANDDWQAELWRQLRRALNAEHWVDLQHKVARAIERQKLGSELLPERVSLFGMTTLSAGYLTLLQQLAGLMDIHLFLFNPCAEHWCGVVDASERSGREFGADSAALYLESGNPLLASLGRQGRDFLSLLLELESPTIDLFGDPGSETLLQLLQGDILMMTDGTAQGRRRFIDSADESIRIHSCHGPMREVEVLRDQLLDLFDRYPQLQPDQVVVMTPDMDLYAPYIEAVFGAASGAGYIPFSIADRSASLESSLTAAFLRLLEIRQSRFLSSELLALLEVPAIRRCFSIAESDLQLIRRWIGESGIRWGRDADHRRELGLPATDQNNWQAGLDRMLLGFALPAGEQRLFAGILPYDEIEGAQAELLSGLSSFVHALFALHQEIAGSHRPRVWSDRLSRLIARFFKPDEDEEQQLQRLREQLAELLEQCRLAGFDEPLSIEVITRQLSMQLVSGSATGGFLNGGVTFCALTPQRILPFQVVCLLGMNDGLFPANQKPPEFDLMARHYRLGDRQRRIEDRYLFLQTLVSARLCLYVSYSGQDIRDNSPLPPSVFISELLDYLQQSFKFSDGVLLSERMPIKHQLQPFHARYFQLRSGLFSYDTLMQAAARERCQPASQSERLLRSPLHPPEEEWRAVELNRLIFFYANPVRFLLRERLGVLLEYPEGELETRDPFAFDYFEEDRLGSQLLLSQLEQRASDRLLDIERASGRLPHGLTGEQLFRQLEQNVSLHANKLIDINKTELKESVKFIFSHNTLTLTGTLPPTPHYPISGCSYKPLPAYRLLGLWIAHLARNVHLGNKSNWETLWLSGEGLIRLPPLSDAALLLGELLELYWEGLSIPLHLFPKSSREYMHWRQRGKEPEYALVKARSKWLGGFHDSGEWVNPYYQLAFPDADVLDPLFQQQSERVFGPLLSVLELS